MNATVGEGSTLGMSIHRAYDQSYDEWLMIITSNNGVYEDAAVNLAITCPTT